MKSAFKFDRQYDVGRLVADLEAARGVGKSHLHFSGHYHDGGWSAIPLVSPGGRIDADGLRHEENGKYEKTPILKHCPYMEEIIDSFKCPKQRIRLMKLESGKNVLEHTDPGDSWALGQARLHIPVVTHEDVHFILAGQRLIMKPGELWYCDFSKPHSVHNKSPIDRVHLVLDLEVNDWMRSIFPSETFKEKVDNFVYWGKFRGDEALRATVRATGIGALRRKLKGGGGAKSQAKAQPAAAKA
jgi:hypothetical protein